MIDVPQGSVLGPIPQQSLHVCERYSDLKTMQMTQRSMLSIAILKVLSKHLPGMP